MKNIPPTLDIHTLLWVKDMMHEHPFLIALEKVMTAISHAEKIQEESWMHGEPPRFDYEEKIHLNRNGIRIIKEKDNDATD
jgi:hypothetical protein